MVRLINENESSILKKALFGDYTGKIKTFAVLTAENPMGKPTKPEINNKKTKNLKALLKRMNLQYAPIEGNFGNIEHSFIIYNLALADAKMLARDFEQLSFFFGKNNFVPNSDNRHTASSVTYYEKSNPNDITSDYIEVETTDRIVDASDLTDFFSRHGDMKFNFKLDYFESVDIRNVLDEDAFNRSLDDRYTGFARLQFRARAYHPINMDRKGE